MLLTQIKLQPDVWQFSFRTVKKLKKQVLLGNVILEIHELDPLTVFNLVTILVSFYPVYLVNTLQPYLQYNTQVGFADVGF